MATHHATDINTLQRSVVEINTHECLSDKTCSRTEPWAVIVFHEIVIDRFRNMDRAQFVVCGLCLLIDDTDGVGRVVSTNVEEVTDVMGFHNFEHARAIFFVGFVAGGEES